MEVAKLKLLPWSSNTLLLQKTIYSNDASHEARYPGSHVRGHQIVTKKVGPKPRREAPKTNKRAWIPDEYNWNYLLCTYFVQLSCLLTYTSLNMVGSVSSDASLVQSFVKKNENLTGFIREATEGL